MNVLPPSEGPATGIRQSKEIDLCFYHRRVQGSSTANSSFQSGSGQRKILAVRFRLKTPRLPSKKASSKQPSPPTQNTKGRGADYGNSERRSYLSSPIERPDRKIIQSRIVIQNHQNYQVCQLGKEIFLQFLFPSRSTRPHTPR